jgi:lipopolysaccharide biosynthesis glycosyltransferase
MHIVTASDNGYVPGVLVLIASAARHNPLAEFTILTTDWSEESRNRLSNMRARLGLRIATVEVGSERLSHLPLRRAHLSASAYSRLFIAEILPKSERVIYMDCDMVVTGDLQRAWSVDLQDKPLAAVACPAPTAAFANAIGLPVAQYFNSGFLVLNLGLWRDEGFGAKCLRALAAPDCPYLSEDESALNDLARGRVAWLDAGFNLYAMDTIWQDPLADPPSICVIHYTRPKPWSGWCPFDELWWHEAAMIPELAGLRQDRDKLKAKLARWNRLRKALIGAALNRPRYARYREARTRIHEVLVPYYLRYGKFPIA